MKKFNIYLLVLLTVLFIPTFVYADENDEWEGYVLEGETTKYYKVETYYEDMANLNNIMDFLNGNVYSVTTEITQEEYDAATAIVPEIYQLRNSCTVETTYKKMTSQIYSHNSTYRYKNHLIWKSFPSVRNYEVIGIGFYASVKPAEFPHFNQYYCTYDDCATLTLRTTQVFTNGASATFKLPSGNLTVLDSTFYFDVEKNTNATIIEQIAAGDYAHATTATVLMNAINHEVVQTAGILFASSVSGYFDTIDEAVTYWTGSW